MVVQATSREEKREVDPQRRAIAELIDFVNAAERMGTYPTNTAGGIKAAIRMASSVLTEQEAESLDTFRSHLDAIFQRVFNKNKSKISAVSLKVYQRRIGSALSDYEQYGRDPQAMANWKRRTRVAAPRKISQGDILLPESGKLESGELGSISVGMNRHELTLRPGVKAILLIPADLSMNETKKIKALLDACTSIE